MAHAYGMPPRCFTGVREHSQMCTLNCWGRADLSAGVCARTRGVGPRHIGACASERQPKAHVFKSMAVFALTCQPVSSVSGLWHAHYLSGAACVREHVFERVKICVCLQFFFWCWS